jgi:hypothetical protein
MRTLDLARVAAEAEALRYRSMIGRHGTRAAIAAVAAVFAISVLVLLNVTGWQLLRLRFEPLYATLILLGVNVVLTALFGALAARSRESRAEIEALQIRQKAVDEMLGLLWRSSRRKSPPKRLR